jgi:hypothetical protein
MVLYPEENIRHVQEWLFQFEMRYDIEKFKNLDMNENFHWLEQFFHCNNL